jgi:hypothetical protein
MRRIVPVVLALTLTACGSDATGASDPTEATAAPSSTTGQAEPATSSIPAPTSATDPDPTISPAPSEPSPDELAVFIAAIEELTIGTVYEGEPIAEPELFLATGWLFCDWLDEGLETDEVLTRYLNELAGSVAEASDDQLVLTGALFGAATAVLCPHHTEPAD